MAQKQLTLPGTVVKKSNELVRGKINVDSTQGGRILASLIACIRQDDTRFEREYCIPAKNFLQSDGGYQYKQIKKICRELAQSTFEYEYDDVFKTPMFIVVPFFSEIEYVNGEIKAQFNNSKKMKECLLQLRSKFTEYNLIEYLQLPSIYSQRIYENLKSWEKTHQEVTIELHKLHYMLNVPESFTKDFREFRRWVLEKAHKDINKKTDLTYAWQPIKKGNAVVKIRFVLGRKQISIAEKQTKELSQAKKSARINKAYVTAFKCARAKDGTCDTEDNKPTVCAMCKQQGLQAEARKSGR